LEEADDLPLQGLHPLGLATVQLPGVSLLLLCPLLLNLLPELGQLLVFGLVIDILRLDLGFDAHVLDDVFDGLLKVIELHKSTGQISWSRVVTTMNSSAAFDGEDAELVLIVLAEGWALRSQEVSEPLSSDDSAVFSILATTSLDHRVFHRLDCVVHCLKQLVSARQVPRGLGPSIDVERGGDLLGENDLVHKLVGVDGALVGLVRVLADELELVLRNWELNQVQDLVKVVKGHKASLLAEDVEDPLEVQALVLDMPTDSAQEVLVVLDVVWRFLVQLQSLLGLFLDFEEDPDEVLVVNGAISREALQLELKADEALITENISVVVLQNVDDNIDFQRASSGSVELSALGEETLSVHFDTSAPDSLMDLAEVVSLSKLLHGVGLEVFWGLAGLSVVVLCDRLHFGDEVLHVNLVGLRKLLEEHFLVDVADPELGEHRPQISLLDELFLLSLASEMAARVQP
jgi:hypothetical protein